MRVHVMSLQGIADLAGFCRGVMSLEMRLGFSSLKEVKLHLTFHLRVSNCFVCSWKKVVIRAIFASTKLIIMW